jgi:hypothetical protein
VGSGFNLVIEAAIKEVNAFPLSPKKPDLSKPLMVIIPILTIFQIDILTVDLIRQRPEVMVLRFVCLDSKSKATIRLLPANNFRNILKIM